MSDRWTGPELRVAVEDALREAGLQSPAQDERSIRMFESALERRLEPFVDVTICTSCGEICEEGEPD